MNATGAKANVTTTAQKIPSPTLVEMLPAVNATARRTIVAPAAR